MSGIVVAGGEKSRPAEIKTLVVMCCTDDKCNYRHAKERLSQGLQVTWFRSIGMAAKAMCRPCSWCMPLIKAYFLLCVFR